MAHRPTPISATRPRASAAFSMIELVIVIVIIGVVAAIAIPRMGSAAETARANALTGSLSVLNKAAEMYMAEHDGRTPAHNAEGAVDPSIADFVRRLLGRTRADGTVDPNGPFGPYLRAMPVNPYNRRIAVRIDGVAAGAGLAGWRFDSARGEFAPDDADGLELVASGKRRLTAAAAEGDSVTALAEMGVESADGPPP